MSLPSLPAVPARCARLFPLGPEPVSCSRSADRCREAFPLAARPFEHRLLVRETAFRTAVHDGKIVIQDLYAALARDESRNAMILNDVVRALEEGRSPILLTERKDHLE